jgi:hypothetical protein
VGFVSYQRGEFFAQRNKTGSITIIQGALPMTERSYHYFMPNTLRMLIAIIATFFLAVLAGNAFGAAVWLLFWRHRKNLGAPVHGIRRRVGHAGELVRAPNHAHGARDDRPRIGRRR